MNVVIHKEDLKTARSKYKEYNLALKTRKEPELKILRKAWWHMAQNRPVLDLYASMKKAGVNDVGQPRLAIARLDWKTVQCNRYEDGSASFFKNWWGSAPNPISVPAGTFKWRRNDRGQMMTSRLEAAKIPAVPASYTKPVNPKTHYVLWEVEEWYEAPPDPFLLRRLSTNLFVVLHQWDLTPLEASLLRGL